MTFKMNTMYKISTLSEMIWFGDNYKFEMDGKYKKPFYNSSKSTILHWFLCLKRTKSRGSLVPTSLFTLITLYCHLNAPHEYDVPLKPSNSRLF